MIKIERKATSHTQEARTPENVHNFAALVDADSLSLLLHILCICHKT